MRDYRESLPKTEKRKKRGRPAKDEAPAIQQAEAEQSARDEIRKGRFLISTRRECIIRTKAIPDSGFKPIGDSGV